MSAAILAGIRKSAAQTAAKDAAAASAKAAAKQSLKSATEAASKEAARTASASVARAASESAAKGALQDAGKETASTLSSKAVKYAAAGVLAAGAGAVVITQYNKANGSKYQIQSIKQTSSGLITITYSPGQKINAKGDTLTLASTDCTPSLDGTVSVSSVPSLTSVIVPGTISGVGTKGTITLNTTFESQMNNDLSSASSSVGSAAGTVVGSTTSGLVGGLASSLGLSSLGSSSTSILVICIVLLVCSSVAAAAFMFLKK